MVFVRGGGTIHSVFNTITSLENLLGAWREFKEGKAKKRDVQEFDFHLEKNLFSLHKELRNKVYVNKPYVPFYVYDPKRRHIHKADVYDRVVHQALYRVLYKIYDPTFIHDSYACRDNKGTHKGVDRLRVYLRKESSNHTRNVWALKCDISKFFDSINHSILEKILLRKLSDSDTQWLIKNIISSFEKSEGCGLPLGNVTSQLFANVYLNEFDQFVKHILKVKYYIRYCDDFVIVSCDREYLESLIPEISRFLESILKLSLHPRKVEIRKISQGIDFLGYILFPHHSILRTSTKKRMLRRMKNTSISREVKQSYLGILKHCKGYKISKDII